MNPAFCGSNMTPPRLQGILVPAKIENSSPLKFHFPSLRLLVTLGLFVNFALLFINHLICVLCYIYLIVSLNPNMPTSILHSNILLKYQEIVCSTGVEIPMTKIPCYMPKCLKSGKDFCKKLSCINYFLLGTSIIPCNWQFKTTLVIFLLLQVKCPMQPGSMSLQ